MWKNTIIEPIGKNKALKVFSSRQILDSSICLQKYFNDKVQQTHQIYGRIKQSEMKNTIKHSEFTPVLMETSVSSTGLSVWETLPCSLSLSLSPPPIPFTVFHPSKPGNQSLPSIHCLCCSFGWSTDLFFTHYCSYLLPLCCPYKEPQSDVSHWYSVKMTEEAERKRKVGEKERQSKRCNHREATTREKHN